jgi:membrane protein YdbS with pleckstrin-like domain
MLVGGLLIVNALWSLTWAVWIAIAVGIAALVGIAFEPRRVRSIGYRLRADDLVFRRGIMFQRQVAVPYGRMQLVDITRGPVARALGLADLKFVTAAAATAVTLPGLPLDEAERLRDELVALAETRRAGL